MNLKERIDRIKTSPLNPKLSDNQKKVYGNSSIRNDVHNYLKSLETEDYQLTDSVHFYRMLKNLQEDKARAVVILASNYEDEIQNGILACLDRQKFRSAVNVLNPNHTSESYDERIVEFVELFYGIASNQNRVEIPRNNCSTKLAEHYENEFLKIRNARETVSQFFMNCQNCKQKNYFESIDTSENIRQLLISKRAIAISGNPFSGKSKVAKAICKSWAKQREIQFQLPIYVDAAQLIDQELDAYLLIKYPSIFENYNSIQNLLTQSSFKLIIDNYHCLSNSKQQHLQKVLKELNQQSYLVFTRISNQYLLQNHYSIQHSIPDQSPYIGRTHDTVYDVQRIHFENQFEDGELKKDMSEKQKHDFLQDVAKLAYQMLRDGQFHMEAQNSTLENEMIRYGIGVIKNKNSKNYFHFKNLNLQYYFACRLIGKNLSEASFLSLMKNENLHDFGNMLLAFKSYYCGKSVFINNILNSQLEVCKKHPNLSNQRRFLTYLSKIDVDTLATEKHEMQVFELLDFLQIFQSGWQQQITDDLKIIYGKLQSDFQNKFKNSFVKQLKEIIEACLTNYSRENFDVLPLFFEMVKTMEWDKSKKFITKLSEIYIEILQSASENRSTYHPQLYGNLYSCFGELVKQFKLLDYTEIKNIRNNIQEASNSLSGFVKYWADSSLQYLKSDEFLLAHCDVIENDFHTRLDHSNDDLSDWVDICCLLAQKHQFSEIHHKERIKKEINTCYDLLLDQRGKGHFSLQLEERLYEAYLMLRLQCVPTSLRFCEKIQQLNVSYWEEQAIDELIQACIKDDSNANNDFISLFIKICESKSIPYKYLPEYLKKIEDRMHAVPHAEKELEFYQQLILEVARYDSTNNYMLSLILSFDFKKYKELRSNILLEIMKDSSFHSSEIWSELKDYANIRQHQKQVLEIISQEALINETRNLEHLVIVWERILSRNNSPKMREPLKLFLTKAKTTQFDLSKDFLELVSDILNNEEIDSIFDNKEIDTNCISTNKEKLKEIIDKNTYCFI